MTEDDVKVIVEDDTKESDDDGLINECIYAVRESYPEAGQAGQVCREEGKESDLRSTL